MRKLIFAIVFSLTFVSAARADRPAKVFAPYMYLGADDDFKLTACDDACGQKFYTLAFVIADKSNDPAWDGRVGMEQNLYADQIDQIRKRGGDVIVSFGGEAGTELSVAESDDGKLVAKYQSVIDRYHLTWLDFDIEGHALRDRQANARRNTALISLVQRNPGVRITYTLPVDPDGISDDSQRFLPTPLPSISRSPARTS